MKTFTCKEMGGVCDEVFTGKTYQEVGKYGGDHIMNSTDEAHADLKKQLQNMDKESQDKWWQWFKGEWDSKMEY